MVKMENSVINLTTMKENLKKQAVTHLSMVYRDKEWLLLGSRVWGIEERRKQLFFIISLCV